MEISIQREIEEAQGRTEKSMATPFSQGLQRAHQANEVGEASGINSDANNNPIEERRPTGESGSGLNVGNVGNENIVDMLDRIQRGSVRHAVSFLNNPWLSQSALTLGLVSPVQLSQMRNLYNNYLSITQADANLLGVSSRIQDYAQGLAVDNAALDAEFGSNGDKRQVDSQQNGRLDYSSGYNILGGGHSSANMWHMRNYNSLYRTAPHYAGPLAGNADFPEFSTMPAGTSTRKSRSASTLVVTNPQGEKVHFIF